MARKCSVPTELSCGVGTYPADVGQRFAEGRQLTAQVHVVEEVVGVDGRHRHLSTTQTRGVYRPAALVDCYWKSGVGTGSTRVYSQFADVDTAVRVDATGCR